MLYFCKKIFTEFRNYVFLGLLLLASASFFYFRLYDYLTLETLKTYQSVVQEWTSQHYTAAIIIYIVVFFTLIACAIPCATFLTLLGGYLFGSIAILYATFSITFGGMILFLSIRTAIGERVAAKATGWIKKIEDGFQENAFNYLLTLRLIPIFPCWISNIGAGVLNVPVLTFLGATILGVLPATIIYVMAGRGLDKVLMDNHTPILDIILTPSLILPLLGLAFLSLLPIIYKSIKKIK